MHIFKAHDKQVADIAFSTDGTLLATLAHSEHLKIWSLNPHELLSGWNSPGYMGSTIAFSPCGKYLAWGGSALTLLQASPPFETIAEDEDGMAIVLRFAPEARQLFTNGHMGVKRFSLPKLERSKDGWDSQTEIANSPGRNVEQSMAIHPNGKVISVRFRDTQPTPKKDYIQFHGIADGKKQREFEYNHPHSPNPEMQFSPDGSMLGALAGTTLMLFHAETGKKVRNLRLSSAHIKDFAFSPDGTRLIFAHGTTVHCLETRKWKEVSAFDWKIGKVLTLAIAPDGMRYAAGGSNGKVVVWDADAG